MKSCSNPKCTQINPQPLSNFGKNKKGKNGLYCHCRPCHNLAGRNRYFGADGRLKQWKNNIQKRYWPELSTEEAYAEFNKLLHKQLGVCAICKKQETELDSKYGTLKMMAVDHCHKTNKVRALLCHKCNRGIGQLLDSAELCLNAAFYLSQH